MSMSLTFEDLEHQVAQLPPRQQLQLVARISTMLSAFSFEGPPVSVQDRREKHDRSTKIDAWLAECERVADLWQGSFDSAADLRRIRDED